MTRSLRGIKNRLRSIQNTEKVTHALEMISASKLNRICKTLYAMRDYYTRLESVLNKFANATPGSSGAKTGLCLITSDSGLCGVYNNNIIRVAEEFIAERGKDNINMIAVGKKGLNYFRKRGVLISNSYTELRGRYSEETAETVAGKAIELFNSGEVAEVYIAYTRYKSAFVCIPATSKFLNIDAAAGEIERYIYEPSRKRVLEELIPKYLSTKMKLLFLEALASEHAARVVAMKTATDNAKELVEKLILQSNKIRQANITQDIMEVIAASESLR